MDKELTIMEPEWRNNHLNWTFVTGQEKDETFTDLIHMQQTDADLPDEETIDGFSMSHLDSDMDEMNDIKPLFEDMETDELVTPAFNDYIQGPVSPSHTNTSSLCSSDLDDPQSDNEYGNTPIHVSSSGDESDAVESVTSKTVIKHFKTKKERVVRPRNPGDQMMLKPLLVYPTRVRRCGYIAGTKYIRHKTFEIQRDTKFACRFFEYKGHDIDMKDALKMISYVPNAAQTEMLVVDLINTFCWPIPFPVVKVEDMKSYEEILHNKRKELKSLLLKVKQTKVSNNSFYQIRLLSLLAFTYIGQNKPGHALEYLQEASEFVLSLEPCEWTGWLFLGYAFYYVAWGATSGPEECFERALPFLEKAYEHFQVDVVEKGASLGIGNSLTLWWMFLIKSKTIRKSDLKQVKAGMSSDVMQGIFSRPKFNLSEEDLRESKFLLKKFQGETKDVEAFPTDMEKTTNIIAAFEKNTVLRAKKKEPYPSSLEETRPDFSDLCTDQESAVDILVLYKKLKSDMAKHKIPMFIQSLRKSAKQGKIIMNVLESKLQEAKQFVEETSPKVYSTNRIKFVPQKYEPGFSMENPAKHVAKKTQYPKNVFTSQLVAFKDNNNDPVREIDIFTGEEYGTFGGPLMDAKTKTIYGSSAKHTITGTSSPDLYGKHTIEKNIYLGNDESQAVKISHQCFGYLGTGNSGKDGVDFGVFPLEESSAKHFLHKTKAGETAQLKVFKGNSSDLKDKLVHKTGATTKHTEGYVLFHDMDFNIDGQWCVGSFIVVSGSSALGPFGLKGDSGSWVILGEHWKDEAMDVCGVIHKVQKEYRYEPEDEEEDGYVVKDITWCLRMDNAIRQINKEFNLNLEIFDNSRDSGYSSGEMLIPTELEGAADNRVSFTRLAATASETTDSDMAVETSLVSEDGGESSDVLF